MPTEIRFLRSAGLVMTYKCQIACPHCIIKASPARKEEIADEDAYSWIEQLARYRNGQVKILSLTGGEPFFNPAKLKRIASFAAGQGLLVAIATNAFWASSLADALRTLEELPEISMLSVSTDVHHQKSISFDNVKNAVSAASACGIPVRISVCTENVADPEYQAIMQNLFKVTAPDTVDTVITFSAGRALINIDKNCYDSSKIPPSSACGSAATPIVFPDGRIIACIGPIIDLKHSHPLVLGNLRETNLAEVFDRAERNVVLHALRIWGPSKLISLLRTAGINTNALGPYLSGSICDACYKIFSNPQLVSTLQSLVSGDEFFRRTAFGRLHYLGETEMLQAGRAEPA